MAEFRASSDSCRIFGVVSSQFNFKVKLKLKYAIMEADNSNRNFLKVEQRNWRVSLTSCLTCIIKRGKWVCGIVFGNWNGNPRSVFLSVEKFPIVGFDCMVSLVQLSCLVLMCVIVVRLYGHFHILLLPGQRGSNLIC